MQTRLRGKQTHSCRGLLCRLWLALVEEQQRSGPKHIVRWDEARWHDCSGALAANEDKIVKELIECQGTPVDLGGYWKPDFAKVDAAMRASPTFNKILDA